MGSDAQGGWAPHPDGGQPSEGLGPVPAGRIVGLGALCELAPNPRLDQKAQSFHVSEFLLMDDGRRVTLHRERGLTLSGARTVGVPGSTAPRVGLTPENLIAQVLNVVLPDDGDEPHPWEWLAGLAGTRGLEATADDLRGLPYEVILADDVQRWLTGS